ncbi:MAG: LysR family transcriptional regulator [Sphingomonas sp.]|jgi:DNA-binding transcriptional LysR family regulator|uniref:LysR family transcriptional regulator n=1 Tax=Sphingomonas sp. TaxID=28214 RepID=UPI003568C77E
MERENLSQLSIFVSVARVSSFREAGRQLNLSSSAISQSIARLERSLATRLFERSTRSVQLTPEGEQLLAQVAPALTSIEQAIETSRTKPGEVRGRLRITAPRLCTTFLLADRLAAFVRAYPSIQLEINVDDSMVDIVGAGFDAGIRLHEQLERDTIAIPIGGPQRMVAVASPAFLAGYAPPAHPRDLLDLPCIALRLESGRLHQWQFEKEGAPFNIAVQGPLIVNDDDLALTLCRDGAGIGFLFEASLREDLASGRLIALLEDWSPAFPGFYLYHTGHRHVRPPLRAFIDWMRRPFAAVVP